MALRPSVRLGNVIPGVLATWERQLESPLHKISSDWESIVGQQIAQHATPVSLRQGVLTVCVDSTVWTSELSSFHSEQITQALNAALGSRQIRQIRFLSRVPTRGVSSGGKEYGEERSEV